MSTPRPDPYSRQGLAGTVSAVAWWLGVGGAAAAAAVTTGEYRVGLPVLVVDHTVVHQMHLVLALAAVSLLALAVSGVATFDPPRPRHVVQRVLIWLTTLAAVLTACGAAFLSAMVADTWTVLDPASPAGCRLLAAEYSFLLAGSGRAFTLPPGTHMIDAGAEPAARWSGDDGYQPVAAGDSTLTWDTEIATLSFAQESQAWFDARGQDEQIEC